MSKKKSDKKNKQSKSKDLKSFDKYYYYYNSVQSAETDVEFFRDTYKELRSKLPTTLREDFCGTHAICCEWVKLNPKFKAVGIDLDLEPIEYGTENYQSQLTAGQKERVEIQHENVLAPGLPEADIVAALNFSYFIFKRRSVLKEYFSNVHKALKPDGIFVIDCFGGTETTEPNEEETEHDNFSYYWDQDSFDPVTNHALFHIHFKRKGEKKREKVFTYDWRMWSIPELRDIMEDAGFKQTYVYWEGTTDDGEGDGNFTRQEHGEDCDSWVAYIVGLR